ncbi:MAG TPA: hypothetical protein VFQ61_29440 [Polyangiaceae bacterium]|nr:hypothetical protein [Polyangiaceae bacterium]
MAPNDPQPHDPADDPYAAVLDYQRTDHAGDRYYSSEPQHYERPLELERHPSRQAYFYRAMTREEAQGWLHPTRYAMPDPSGHHPWASNRDYSAGYLTRRHGYTHLVEVYAPDFVPQMMSIGFVSGKAEAGDISWGIGGTPSNGWRGSKTTNKVLESAYADLKGRKVSPKEVRGRERGMANELAPYLFKDSIRSVRVVDLRSQKPGR